MTERPDYRESRDWIKNGGLMRGWPMMGDEHGPVCCSICGSEGCALYPSPEQDEQEYAPTRAVPSLICPNCSAPVVEAYQRWRCEQAGYELDPRGVFPSATGASA